MSTASEIGSRLVAQGLGTTGTDLYEGLLPESPANCIAIYEKPGRFPERAMANTIVADQPHVVVTVRNTDYETGYTKAKAVQTALQNFKGTLSGVVYYQITALGAIGSLGVDENSRFRFSQTFLVMKASS